MPGRLHIVGTPIGNLGDLTDRARATLAAVDLIAAEDTRRTGRLLTHLGISVRMLSLFEGNERSQTEQVLRELHGGAEVALVSDAGMPLVSDPGYRLVRACSEAGIDVLVVPGPSAVTAALAVSGLPTDRWVFEGFLPRRTAERRTRLGALVDEPRTIVLFESARRLRGLLTDMVSELGDRRIAVARELTKLHEEVLRGPASEVLDDLAEGPRGEVVVVVEGARAGRRVDLGARVEEARRLVEGGMRKREAAATVARGSGASANVIYRALIGPHGRRD